MHKEKVARVYNFYTYEPLHDVDYTDHMQRIMGIDWFNNDMGFTTCAHDGNIYFYELRGGEAERKRSYEANFRDVKFSSVVNLLGKQ